MPTVSGKQPLARLATESTPVRAQCIEQLGAEHDIAIFASLATLDVNDHPLAVDVADFQVRQLGIPRSRGVQRHEQSAMVGSERRIDESRDFFLAQDRRKVKGSLRIGSLSGAPGLVECLAVEKTQGRQVVCYGTR
jgi:hypothetical protein